jgi:hypothetical protein
VCFVYKRPRYSRATVRVVKGIRRLGEARRRRVDGGRERKRSEIEDRPCFIPFIDAPVLLLRNELALGAM